MNEVKGRKHRFKADPGFPVDVGASTLSERTPTPEFKQIGFERRDTAAGISLCRSASAGVQEKHFYGERLSRCRHIMALRQYKIRTQEKWPDLKTE